MGELGRLARTLHRRSDSLRWSRARGIAFLCLASLLFLIDASANRRDKEENAYKIPVGHYRKKKETTPPRRIAPPEIPFEDRLTTKLGLHHLKKLKIIIPKPFDPPSFQLGFKRAQYSEIDQEDDHQDSYNHPLWWETLASQWRSRTDAFQHKGNSEDLIPSLSHRHGFKRWISHSQQKQPVSKNEASDKNWWQALNQKHQQKRFSPTTSEGFEKLLQSHDQSRTQKPPKGKGATPVLNPTLTQRKNPFLQWKSLKNNNPDNIATPSPEKNRSRFSLTQKLSDPTKNLTSSGEKSWRALTQNPSFRNSKGAKTTSGFKTDSLTSKAPSSKPSHKAPFGQLKNLLSLKLPPLNTSTSPASKGFDFATLPQSKSQDSPTQNQSFQLGWPKWSIKSQPRQRPSLREMRQLKDRAYSIPTETIDEPTQGADSLISNEKNPLRYRPNERYQLIYWNNSAKPTLVQPDSRGRISIPEIGSIKIDQLPAMDLLQSIESQMTSTPHQGILLLPQYRNIRGLHLVGDLGKASILEVEQIDLANALLRAGFNGSQAHTLYIFPHGFSDKGLKTIHWDGQNIPAPVTLNRKAIVLVQKQKLDPKNLKSALQQALLKLYLKF